MTDFFLDKQRQIGLNERVYEQEDINLFQAIDIIKEDIKNLFKRLPDAKSEAEIDTISIKITELKKQKDLIDDAINKREKKRNEALKEYIELNEGVHKHEKVYEYVAKIFGLSLSDLKNNYPNFLAIRQQKYLLGLAKRISSKSSQPKETPDLKQKFDELSQQTEALESQVNILKRQREEDIRENERLRKEKEERDKIIDEFRYQESQIENKVNKALKVWRDQQAKIKAGKRPLADESVGILLAEAALETYALFDSGEVTTRDEHSLRDTLFKKLKNPERDYFSDRCRDAVRQCNNYLRGRHPQQSLIDSVLFDEMPLEEMVLAFDRESSFWWWLCYIHLQIQTGNPDSDIVAIRRHLRNNDGVEDNPSYDEFFALYEIDPELRELIISLFDQSLDKAKMSELNVK